MMLDEVQMGVPKQSRAPVVLDLALYEHPSMILKSQHHPKFLKHNYL